MSAVHESQVDGVVHLTDRAIRKMIERNIRHTEFDRRSGAPGPDLPAGHPPGRPVPGTSPRSSRPGLTRCNLPLARSAPAVCLEEGMRSPGQEAVAVDGGETTKVHQAQGAGQQLVCPVLGVRRSP